MKAAGVHALACNEKLDKVYVTKKAKVYYSSNDAYNANRTDGIEPKDAEPMEVTRSANIKDVDAEAKKLGAAHEKAVAAAKQAQAERLEAKSILRDALKGVRSAK